MRSDKVKPDAIAHFAAFAYVGESVGDPGMYYSNNTQGTLNILEAMRDGGVDKFLFSSTCATYGVPQSMPIHEELPQSPINPYGWSKLFVEKMMWDFSAAHYISAVALRYFTLPELTAMQRSVNATTRSRMLSQTLFAAP